MSRDGFILFRRDNTLMAQPFNPDRLETTGGVIPIAEQVSVAGNVGYGAFTASQDGTLAYFAGISGGSRQLVWLDRSGKRLGSVAKPDEISNPSLSPDGSAVAFSVGNFTARASGLWLQDLKSGVLSRLTFGSQPSDYPIWSPDGHRIAYTVSAGPTSQIQAVDATGSGRSDAVLDGPYFSIGVSDWSSDGKLIAFSNRGANTNDDIWLLPTGGDRKAVVFLQTRATERGARFSPSGEWLAYSSDESGR